MKRNGRTMIIALVLGGVAAFCFEVGGRIGAEETQRYTTGVMALRMLAWTAISSVLIYLSWTKLSVAVYPNGCGVGTSVALPFGVLMLLFMAMWTPVFLSIFPGAFAYDAPTQWEQFTGWQLNAHHPVLHTLLIGMFLEGGAKLLGSYNAGIALYTIMQMLVTAAVFSYAVCFMRKYRVPSLLRGFAILVWGLSPTVQLFVISSTKDTLFTGVFLLFILSLIDYGCRREEFLSRTANKVMFVLSAIGTMILRNNGFYIVIIILALMLLRREGRKTLLLLVGCIVAFYIIYTGPVYRLLGVEKGSVGEMMCVPLQQMARTYIYNYNELEQEDIRLLEAVVPREDLLNYVPTLADVVKRNFKADIFKENLGAYLKLWIKWGMRYPTVYIQSFLINTSDYWYPWAVVDGYNPGTESIDFFRYSVGAPGERVEMLPRIHELYRTLSEDRSTSEKPIAALLTSPGWYLLATMYLCATYLKQRRKGFFLPYTALALTVATALLGPIAQVRYVLILYYTFPLLCVMLGSDTENSRRETAEQN